MDKVGAGACRLSRLALEAGCVIFDQLIIYCINNTLAWLFDARWGSCRSCPRLLWVDLLITLVCLPEGHVKPGFTPVEQFLSS